jgi:hypothetical protein
MLPVAQHQFANVQVQRVDRPDVNHLCVTSITFLNAEKFVTLLTSKVPKQLSNFLAGILTNDSETTI